MIDNNICGHFVLIQNIWEYICIYQKKYNIENEPELFRIFFEFITMRNEIYKMKNISNNDNNFRLFHWAPAELRFMNKAINRIKLSNNTNNIKKLYELINYFERSCMWIDMCGIFESEPIVVKGSYRFKLKHIGKALYKNGLIKTKLDNEKMSDGFAAMLVAIKLYRNNNDINHETNIDFKEIIKYNEFDCKIIWEIVNYLRNNHCKISNKISNDTLNM